MDDLLDDDRALHLVDACIFAHCRNGAGTRAALVDRDFNLTYDELAHRVAFVATELSAKELNPKSLVFLALSENVDFAISFFAAMAAGLYVVPVSPHLRLRDLALLAAAFKPGALLTQSERLSDFAELKRVHPELKVIDGSFHSPTAAGRNSSWPFNRREEYGYGVLTSGTSGIPKLVLRRHEDIVVGWSCYARGVLGMTDSDVVYSTAPFCFGYGLGSGLIFPLLSGGTAVLGGSDCTFERIKRNKPSILFSQPSALREIIRSLEPRSLRNSRVTVSAGERLPSSLAQEWVSQFGHPILDGYGTTEIGHVFVSQTVDRMLPGSVGRVVPGFSLDLVDADGDPCEPGKPGILRVRGPARHSSYYLDEAATRQTFEGSAVLTPDLATISAEGDVFILGRTGDMIQVGSEVVSLAALEQCVLALPFVKECYLSKPKLSERIQANYVVMDVVVSTVPSKPADMKREIARAIHVATTHALVAEENIIFVDALARNANGKTIGSREERAQSAQFKC